MASKRPHKKGWLIRWREPASADPRRRTQRSWVCSESEAHAEVYRQQAEAAEKAGERWTPPDGRGPGSGPGRPPVNDADAALVRERGLQGVMAIYIRFRRVTHERRMSTVQDLQQTLRGFLRWVEQHEGVVRNERVDPGVMSHALLEHWWTWMLSEDRRVEVTVRRKHTSYTRVYEGPLSRQSAYKCWRIVVAFWKFAAQLDASRDAMPPCPDALLKKPYKDPNASVGGRRPVIVAEWHQVARVVSLVKDWVQPLAILLYYTGLRVGQARSLTWDDVFLDGPEAARHGGPVLWIGDGKTTKERDGRWLPIHPALAAWLRRRKADPGHPERLSKHLRRKATKAYQARVAAFEAGRIAWEIGAQNPSLQMTQAWTAAGVPRDVWFYRSDHAFRKALRTNIVTSETMSDPLAWAAAERLLGHDLGGQIGTYQSDRPLMPTMRALIATVPRWETASLTVHRGGATADGAAGEGDADAFLAGLG